jgi:hypothetical protein
MTQGAALAALGMVAGCAGRSERAEGNEGGRSGTAGGFSSGGSTLQGGTGAGGGSGAQGGSNAGTTSAGGAMHIAGAGGMGGHEPRGGAAGSALGGAAGSDLGGAAGSDLGGAGGMPGLEPYPLDDVGCFGPSFDAGYEGQCCTSAHCYTPSGGGCVGVDERPPIPLPPGSGTCGCPAGQGQADAVRGPYAPNPGGMPLEAGTCCYLVGSISCEGRPLVVAGAAIVAPLVRRGDWCAALA